MSEQLMIPEGYREMFSAYAERNHQTELTAFSNLMDFIQVKEGAFSEVRIAIEDPKRYLYEGDSLGEMAVLQLYMDTFGEDSVGATVRGYYNPDRLDTLLLEIEYDNEVAIWEMLQMFHYQIPSIDLTEEGAVELFYVSDILGEKTEEARSLFSWFRDSEREDDGFGKAGYYEALYEEPDDEEFYDDEELEDFESFRDDEEIVESEGLEMFADGVEE